MPIVQILPCKGAGKTKNVVLLLTVTMGNNVQSYMPIIVQITPCKRAGE
jgi:hypothetical protein